MIGNNFTSFASLFEHNFVVNKNRSERTNSVYVFIAHISDPDDTIATITLRDDTVVLLSLYFDEGICFREVVMNYGNPSQVRKQNNNLVYIYSDRHMQVYATTLAPQVVDQIHFAHDGAYPNFMSIDDIPKWRNISLKSCRET